ncbi:MurR/RpiR family transcriptional regulator [Endobacter medicaginis]|nr:MurR/RpiR family transcriptional regulator [Endobacter medicaginis]MCX5476464.1 MurR/RpiR family transcriptional regulator [Endobacter medicaginis]NVN29749.1 MurR/RpiR family transcriptional regulator [Endobacter medicaginis]
MSSRSLEPAGETPRDFKSLRELILARRDDMPKRLVQVADYAVAHPQEIAFARVADLAQAAGVQPSTLVRFAQSLGYSGFSDLQAVFRAHARRRWPEYRERLEQLGEPDAADPADPSPAGLLAGFVHASRVSLDHLEQTVEPEALERCIALLCEARNIVLLGNRRVYPVALYLLYALRRLGVRAECLDNAGSLAERHADLLGEGDVVLAISFTPYAADTLALATAAAKGGARVVAITDSPFSPLTQLAETWLEVAETDHAGFRSLSATFALATTLAVAVAERRAHRP